MMENDAKQEPLQLQQEAPPHLVRQGFSLMTDQMS
jgi:hypothetical protein